MVVPLKFQKLPKFDKGYGSILGSGWGGEKERDEGKHGKEKREDTGNYISKHVFWKLHTQVPK